MTTAVPLHYSLNQNFAPPSRPLLCSKIEQCGRGATHNPLIQNRPPPTYKGPTSPAARFFTINPSFTRQKKKSSTPQPRLKQITTPSSMTTNAESPSHQEIDQEKPPATTPTYNYSAVTTPLDLQLLSLTLKHTLPALLPSRPPSTPEQCEERERQQPAPLSP